jgi:integrase/recombinase XerC
LGTANRGSVVIRPEALPSGRWRGIVHNPATRKKSTRTFDRFKEALDWSAAEQAKIDGGSPVTTVARQQLVIPTFAEHVVQWAHLGIEDGELSTVRGYQSQARMLAARWPTQRVDQITELMIREYLGELRDAGASPSTRTLRLTVMRHCLRAAVKAGYRADDPTVGIKAPKRREHQPRILTEPELLLVEAALPGWLWPAATLGHDTGMRIGELAGLRMLNLDLLHGAVSIVDIINERDGKLREYTKSKISRDVPLSQRCLTALRDHVRDHPPAGSLGFVFANPSTGGHLTPQRIRAEWDRALKVAKLEGKKPTPHDLRHGAGTTLGDAGVDPWAIKEFLGHGSIATSQRYVRKANMSRLTAAVRQAFDSDSAFGSSSPQANLA